MPEPTARENSKAVFGGAHNDTNESLRIYHQLKFDQYRNRKFHEIAKNLDNNRVSYGIYGVLDGLSLRQAMESYGATLKSLSMGTSSSDILHSWLSSPNGIAELVCTSLLMMVLSGLGNYFDDDDAVAYKRYIAIIWPYIRDMLKAIKNTFKGIASTLQIAGQLANQDLRFLLLPLGIGLGVVALINRAAIRAFVVTPRKEYMSLNTKLWQRIKSENLTERNSYTDILENCDVFKGMIKRQSLSLRRYAYFAVWFRGVLDGLYLYMGVMTIAYVAPAFFLPMVVICAFFALATIIARVYEEYAYQSDLRVTELRAELLLEAIKLEHMICNAFDAEATSITTIIDTFEESWKAFEAIRKQLIRYQRLSPLKAALAGLRDGLMIYGVIASFLFAVSIITNMLAMAFPPALLIAGIVSGLVCLIAFMAYSINEHSTYQQYAKSADLVIETDIMTTIYSVKTSLETAKADLSPEEKNKFKQRLSERMTVDPLPFYFQEGAECVRGYASAWGKARGAVSSIFSCFQTKDANGHYRDSKIIFLLTILMAAVYAVVRSLRALARGFGKPRPIAAVGSAPPKKAAPPPAPPKVVEENVFSVVKSDDKDLSDDSEVFSSGSDRESKASSYGSVSSLGVFAKSRRHRSESHEKEGFAIPKKKYRRTRSEPADLSSNDEAPQSPSPTRDHSPLLIRGSSMPAF